MTPFLVGDGALYVLESCITGLCKFPSRSGKWWHKLLCENFQGIKVESFAEFSNISSRLRDWTYEPSPRFGESSRKSVKKWQMKKTTLYMIYAKKCFTFLA
ncbi:hypothetical protein MKW98_007957 [Papaver atlanticum]|uniref:Uncharacterized protein n=1 Tax=Papaver atlanticum TaxID=357466 RepID=A0AAD4XA12_9MAGN|nr:hypothetical protein MKW98_007957 [Papaver atlanticum]